MADAVSIQDTNKIRLALGLKPLPIPGADPGFKYSKDLDNSSDEEEPGSTLESRQAEGYANWKHLQEEADAKAKREAKNEAIKKARDAAKKFTKLEGKGLGEEDDVTSLDMKTWLIQQKKRQKNLEKEREKTKRMEEELRAREEAAQYTAQDLIGIKVGHELREFEKGKEQVLTLKDSTIDENEEEGDELENMDLREREKLTEKLELQKKKPDYNPNDIDEDGKQVLLRHYDQAIDGKKRKRFTLDAFGSTSEEREALGQTVGERLKSQAISLDTPNDVPASDYLDISEIKMKRPKKKREKSIRQKAVDEDNNFPTIELIDSIEASAHKMEVDAGSTKAAAARLLQPRNTNVSFIDDDDLQASLAKQRREAFRKRKKMKPEDLARQLREKALANPGPENGNFDDPAEGPGMVIDETSEFVTNLQRPTTDNRTRTVSSPVKAQSLSVTTAAEDDDVDLENEEEYKEEIATRLKQEKLPAAPNHLTGTGLDEEHTLNKGVGSTLSLLTERGLLQNGDDTSDLNGLHRERQKFLAEKQKRETAAEQKARIQRERDRASGKLDRMSAREREEYARWENKQRDQAESRQMAEIFSREYKPNVQLKYVDEFGRSMNQKEAFKHLSHQFHGKGSGKQKTEKHLKKIEDEKKREAMSSLDSSRATGMNNAVEATAKKNKTAGVRLA